MTQFSIRYAKTHLSKLLEAVARGEDIVIAKSSKPMAKLVPFDVIEPPKKESAWELLAGNFEGQPSTTEVAYLCASNDPQMVDAFYGESENAKSPPPM